MNCSRCGEWVGPVSWHIGDRIVLCELCGAAWNASAEGRRLGAITNSIYSEWIERLRCEALSEAEQAKTEAAAPTAAPTEGHKS